MENGNEVLTIMLISLSGAGIIFVFLLCKMMNIGESERKAKVKEKQK